MAASDGLDIEEVGRLHGVGGLAVGDLFAGGVEGVNPNEVGGLRDVPLDGVGVGVVGGGVGSFHDRVLARLVLLHDVNGLPPTPILLADRGVAQLRFHRLIARICPRGVGCVQRPRYGYCVFSGLQNCQESS